jgi:hypothetical protein
VKRIAVLVLLASPATAAADAQWSARQAMGGGAALGEQDHHPVFDLAWRSELLFGARGDQYPRTGPAIEIRTETFDSIELASGPALLIPTWRGFPIVLTALAGYAFRDGPDDAPIGVGTFAWGYRGYDHHGFYGLGLMAYVTTRFDLDEPSRWQITFGIEVDLEILFVVPILALKMLFTRGDPDEPDEEEEEDAGQ